MADEHEITYSEVLKKVNEKRDILDKIDEEMLLSPETSNLTKLRIMMRQYYRAYDKAADALWTELGYAKDYDMSDDEANEFEDQVNARLQESGEGGIFAMVYAKINEPKGPRLESMTVEQLEAAVAHTTKRIAELSSED